MRLRGFVARFAGVAIILSVAAANVGSTSANTTGRAEASASASCSNATYNGGKYAGKLTYRFVLHGQVSCNEAHRTMGAYVHAIVTGQCRSRICTQVVFAGGWKCATLSSVESREHGGLQSDCQRKGARFDLYKPRSLAAGPSVFAASVPGGYIRCGTTGTQTSPAPPGGLACVSEKFGHTASPGEPDPGVAEQHAALVQPNGQVTTCPPLSSLCTNGAIGYSNPPPKIYPAGTHLAIKQFACTVLAAGIECTIATGKGFRITVDQATLVGG